MTVMLDATSNLAVTAFDVRFEGNRERRIALSRRNFWPEREEILWTATTFFGPDRPFKICPEMTETAFCARMSCFPDFDGLTWTDTLLELEDVVAVMHAPREVQLTDGRVATSFSGPAPAGWTRFNTPAMCIYMRDGFHVTVSEIDQHGARSRQIGVSRPEDGRRLIDREVAEIAATFGGAGATLTNRQELPRRMATTAKGTLLMLELTLPGGAPAARGEAYLMSTHVGRA